MYILYAKLNRINADYIFEKIKKHQYILEGKIKLRFYLYMS